MRSLSALLSVCLLSASTAARAQQGVAKPAITVPPSSAPVQATPAAVPVQAATSTPSTKTPAAPPPQVSDSYVIGADDAIQVTVWKEPTLSGPLAVRPDGMISLPLLGDIPAAGLTPMALSQNLTTQLKKYITDPTVTVTVVAVNSQRIYLIGEVQHAGPLALTPGMTFLQVISAAGGLTPYANAKHIYILRGVQGKQQKISFNYKKALKDGNMQGVQLFPGDTIVVP